MRRVVCVGIATIVLLSGGCGRVGGEPFQPSSNTPVTLEDGNSVGQILNPNGDSVSEIDVSVATFAQQADPQGVLTVTLDGRGERRSAIVSGADIADGAWVAATFDPPAPVDDLTTMDITWEGTTPIALWSNQDLAGTSGISNDPYAAGQIVLDGRPTTGDLAFRVTTESGLSDGLAQFVEVMRGAAARLVDQPVFTLVWTILLIGSAVLAVRGRRAQRLGR